MHMNYDDIYDSITTIEIPNGTYDTITELEDINNDYDMYSLLSVKEEVTARYLKKLSSKRIHCDKLESYIPACISLLYSGAKEKSMLMLILIITHYEQYGNVINMEILLNNILSVGIPDGKSMSFIKNSIKLGKIDDLTIYNRQTARDYSTKLNED